MTNFIPRPYKLYNRIQHYDWGTRNGSAFIPKLLGINAEPDEPYAELWIGAHPKAPSEIDMGGMRIGLDRIIAAHPREALGDYVLRKFSGKLPFLLKVLSAARALSIQAHPDKAQAVRLHTSDPEHYPDDNHKPEIAIALDSLNALVGFKPAPSIASSLGLLPELREFVDAGLLDEVLAAGNGSEPEAPIKKLYADMMRRTNDKEGLAGCIEKIRARLSRTPSSHPEEVQFLKQHKLYGPDVGLFSFFFFNMVQLKPGQAIFTDAGVPHAYLSGNIIECMANSDNVVRAGLTHKFRDVGTLLDIIRYEFAECDIINSEQRSDGVVYQTRAEEFRITRFRKSVNFKQRREPKGRPSVCLVVEGRLEVSWVEEGVSRAMTSSRGESFFIPAALTEYTVSSSSGADYFLAEVP